ncbi:Olfactory receptor 7G2 [Sciurus carolinensis]|uniref:Olfactory receptor 7G2 n=1 Tax=Sciurus carolinensis TaxID=30640 RepID=A0AA41MZG6_SCICA|nr:Olfactory receptor 7G2 [Sciurus carolinensis]
MKARNQTVISEFLLLGLTENPALQPLIFSLFLSMYLVTILGNLLIILAISSDSHLHTPMTGFGVYISSAVTDSSRDSAVASMMYSVVPQMLNPFIYSLRNRDMKVSVRMLMGRTPSVL